MGVSCATQPQTPLTAARKLAAAVCPYSPLAREGKQPQHDPGFGAIAHGASLVEVACRFHSRQPAQLRAGAFRHARRNRLLHLAAADVVRSRFASGRAEGSCPPGDAQPIKKIIAAVKVSVVAMEHVCCCPVGHGTTICTSSEYVLSSPLVSTEVVT